jgi:penicillin-binding protein 2
MAVDRRAARMSVLGLVCALLLGGLGVRVWFLQVVEREAYQAEVSAQKTRTVFIPAERGRIFDAEGRVLAGNEPIVTITVDRSVLRTKEERRILFERLSGPLNVPVDELHRRYDPCYGTPAGETCTKGSIYDPLLPLPLKEDVDEDVVAYLRERAEDYPGINTVEQWRRVYPYAPLASHVVGYMGSINAETLDRYLQAGYRRDERVGQFGIEASMERQLHGVWGRRVYEIDAAGRIVRELTDQRVDPIAGNDIQLTIDLDIQQYAEQALEDKLKQRRNLSIDSDDKPAKNPIDIEEQKINPNTTKRAFSSSKEYGTQEWIQFKSPAGAVVILDHTNGQVVAMASYPTFDNRWMSSGASSAKLAEIFPAQGPPDAAGNPTPADPDKATLVNRAVQARYNLGSTIKPFIGWSAIHSGIITPEYTYLDEGTYTLETIERPDCQDQGGPAKCIFKNATSSGTGRPTTYGPVNIVSALAVSSDAFFYRIGELFWDRDEDAGIRDAEGYTVNTLKADLQRFGFGSDTGIQLPYEWDGRIPDDKVKAQLVDAGVLAEGEVERLVVGDSVQVAIGQGLMAATPLQIAVGYGTIANGGVRNQPTIIKNIYAPFVPDAGPAMADLSKGTVITSFESPIVADRLETENNLEYIDAGLRRVITGPGTTYPGDTYHATTGEKLFAGWNVVDIAGKTGTAQGAGNYPWNDSAAFGAYSRDAEVPYTVVAYLEKSGYGSRGAAPAVKCMFEALAGQAVLDPVVVSDQLDLNSTVPAPPKELPNDACLAFTGGAVGRG